MKSLIVGLCVLVFAGWSFANETYSQLYKKLDESISKGISKPKNDVFLEFFYHALPNTQQECQIALFRNAMKFYIDDDPEEIRSDMYKFDFSKMSEKSVIYQDITDGSDKVAKAIVAIVSEDGKPMPIEVYDSTFAYNNDRFYDVQSWDFLGVTQAPYFGVGFRSKENALKFRKAVVDFIQYCI